MDNLEKQTKGDGYIPEKGVWKPASNKENFKETRNLRRASFYMGVTERKHSMVVMSKEVDGDSNEGAPIPPDGGYGYVIVFAAFLSNVIVDGIVYSFGSLKDSIYEDIKRQSLTGGPALDQATVAWVGSSLTGVYLIMGPFVSAASNKLGFRVVAVMGSLVASSGFILAWYLNLNGANMTYLCVFYGIIGGTGFSCIYIPAVIAVGFYFDKKRALATGIAVCGSGVGNFIFPPLIAFLTAQWQWQGAILAMGLIVLICALLGLLYKPLQSPVPAKLAEDLQKEPLGLSLPKKLIGRIRLNSAWIVSEAVNPKIDEVIVNKPMYNENILNARNLLVKENATQQSAIPLPCCRMSDISSLKTAYNVSDKSLWLGMRKLFQAVTKLWDFSLLLSPSFLVLAASSMFAMLGLFVPFVYIMDQAQFVLTVGQVSPDKSTLTLLLSMIGAANTLGRIISGWLADRPFINVLMLYNAAVTLMGVSSLVVPFLAAYYQFIIFSCVFGFSLACFNSLRSIILVEFLGLDKLTNAFGLLLLFLGIASTVATPVAGTIVTLSGSSNDFSVAFFFGGGCLIFSAFMCYPLNIIKKWETGGNDESLPVSDEKGKISS